MSERVAIVGSRDYPRLAAVREYVRGLPPGTIVVSGGARGVDQAAEAEARACGLLVVTHLPDYARFGRRAPLVRNEAIVRSCDRLVAFIWRESSGTSHAIRCALASGKPVESVIPGGEE